MSLLFGDAGWPCEAILFILKATISALHHVPSSEKVLRGILSSFIYHRDIKEGAFMASFRHGWAEEPAPRPPPRLVTVARLHQLTTAKPCCTNSYLYGTVSFLQSKCAHMHRTVRMRTAEEEKLIYSGWKHLWWKPSRLQRLAPTPGLLLIMSISISDIKICTS